MVYLSDGTPIDLNALNWTANGYDIEGEERSVFEITKDGNLKGIDNSHSGYFCQIDCSVEGMERHIINAMQLTNKPLL